MKSGGWAQSKQSLPPENLETWLTITPKLRLESDEHFWSARCKSRFHFRKQRTSQRNCPLLPNFRQTEEKFQPKLPKKLSTLTTQRNASQFPPHISRPHLSPANRETIHDPEPNSPAKCVAVLSPVAHRSVITVKPISPATRSALSKAPSINPTQVAVCSPAK